MSNMAPKRRNGSPNGDGSTLQDRVNLLSSQTADKKSVNPNQRKRFLMLGSGILLLGVTLSYSDSSSWDLDNASPFSTKGPVVKDTRYSKRGLYDYHDICVVGAGLSGSVIAERYASQRNATSLIIERRDHIGGNCYDFVDSETGILVSKYGAHLFHTNYERVWEYVQHFSEWTPYEHEVLALVEGKHVPVPVNIDTVNALFGLKIQNSDEMDQWLEKEQEKYPNGPTNSEEMAMSRVGKRLYELIFHPYTIKQWDKEPRELGPEVTARIPVRNNHDGRYFGDPHQALPSKGYTKIFQKMVMENPLITMKLQTDYFEVRNKLRCGKLYYTGPIDRYFADLGWPKLEYRSLDFERRVVKNVDKFQPKGVVNHPSADVNFTRIVEYKHFLDQKSPHTILFYEHSKDTGEPYYPVPNPVNKELFERYKRMAQQENDVTFVGRLANYKYFNMDQTIENALQLFDDDVATLHVIVYQKHCREDISWLKSWKDVLPISHAYVYTECANNNNDRAEPIVDVEIVPVNGKHGNQWWQQHIRRTDIQFASQNMFVGAHLPMLDAKDSYTRLMSESSRGKFSDYAVLPFKDCRASKCSRTISGKDQQFYVSHEAIKRFLGGIPLGAKQRQPEGSKTG